MRARMFIPGCGFSVHLFICLFVLFVVVLRAHSNVYLSLLLLPPPPARPLHAETEVDLFIFFKVGWVQVVVDVEMTDLKKGVLVSSFIIVVITVIVLDVRFDFICYIFMIVIVIIVRILAVVTADIMDN